MRDATYPGVQYSCAVHSCSQSTINKQTKITAMKAKYKQESGAQEKLR